LKNDRKGLEARIRDQDQVYLTESVCKSQFPHKFVNLFFILALMKAKLTNLWGN